jgi:DNA invertase Pin-like site-specific DNA recombinase
MNNPLSFPIPSKIVPNHLQRLALIYVRQSSTKQVENNKESQLYQYNLVERARSMGWPPPQIRVIDADLGLSGQGSDYRSGFKELVAEVSLGNVGLVVGYEVSRLARNNSDWYQLLDLCAVFGTLIADTDGLYDPRLYNDRLLLGLKGTMSEAELHLLKLRMAEGRMNQVRRGVYRQHLPTGLLRLPDGSVILDPDAQVRHTLEMLFVQFVALGSCEKLLRYCRRENVLLPRRQTSGFSAGRLLWKEAAAAAIYDILRNPAYAGAFAYGRRQVDPARRRPGQRATGLAYKPLSEWLYLQQDVYPAYLSWDQFLANQQRLHENATRVFAAPVGEGNTAQGAARAGAALLQGLVLCGKCGCRMRVAYKHTPRYHCDALARRYDRPRCASFPIPSVDQVVVEAFLEAVRPAQLDALEAVLAEQIADQTRLRRQWQERLVRARYEVGLAQRQYEAVDPQNRLVAAELERRWEEKLLQLRQVDQEVQRFEQQAQRPALSETTKQQFRTICQTLPVLWEQGELCGVQKKELLRSLIASVVLRALAPDRVEVKIVWVSGHYSLHEVPLRVHREADVSGHEAMIERIGQLWQSGQSDEQIAVTLTAEGFRSARRLEVTGPCVQKIRLDRGWYQTLHQSRGALELEGYLTPRGLASVLGVEQTWVYRRLYKGEIEARYLRRSAQGNVWLIQNDPVLLASLRAQRVDPTSADGGSPPQGTQCTNG